MKQLYIDIGSSTVKIYSVLGSNVELLETKSLPFKKSIDPEVGLAETVKQEPSKIGRASCRERV